MSRTKEEQAIEILEQTIIRLLRELAEAKETIERYKLSEKKEG